MKYTYDNTTSKNTYELKQDKLNNNEELSLIRVYKNDILIGILGFSEIAELAENHRDF